MNKTVNINLAGIFFYIDEDAYKKLQHYLKAIQNSLGNSEATTEIMADIESRIAELFSESQSSDRQVIGIHEVEKVIKIMGQPEEYLVEEDATSSYTNTTSSRTKTKKQLFRDTENSYIGGVAAGLAHYIGVEPIWVRILFLLLLFGGGSGVLIYVVLWMLMPEAKTASDKLLMYGEPVNINNIEKKIKDGFTSVSDSVSDTFKNVDINKQTENIKRTSRNFFDTLSDIFGTLLKIAYKACGILFIIIGATTLLLLTIALIYGMFIDTSNIHIPPFNFNEASNVTNTPFWFVALLTFFAFGIPFFFLLYLGLRIVFKNINAIGTSAKLSLLGIWVLAIIGWIVIGISQISAHAYHAKVTETQTVALAKKDTITIQMREQKETAYSYFENTSDYSIGFTASGEKEIYSSNIKLKIKSTQDTLATIKITKEANGKNFESARKRAEAISYHYTITKNTIALNDYLSTAIQNKYNNQEVEIVLELPKNNVVILDANTQDFIYSHLTQDNFISPSDASKTLKIIANEALCLNCDDDDYSVHIDVSKNNDASLKIDEQGIDIKSEDSNLKIDKNGIRASSEDVKVNIDKDGIQIKTEE